MSHPEEFGVIKHHGADGFIRTWYVWAEVDPETFEVNRIYYDIVNKIPFHGYTPAECISPLQRAVKMHIEESIVASQELLEEDWAMEEDSILIDDNDPLLSKNTHRLH